MTQEMVEAIKESEVSPKVSVVMTVYNGEQFLEEAVRSILNQTYRDLELIVVDDGSTDSSSAILSRIATTDNRLKIHITPNRGLASARNFGLGKIRGEVVTFVDADDVVHPESVARFVEMMDDESVDVVASRFIMSENEPSGWRENPLVITRRRHISGDEALTVSLYQRPAMNSVCQLAIRACLLKGEDGLRFKDGIYYEDLEFTSRLYPRCRAVVSAEMSHYFYRQNGGSFIHQLSPRRLDVLSVTEGIEQMATKMTKELQRAAYDRRYSACFNIYLLTANRVEELYRRAADLCWKEIKRRRLRTLLNPRVRLKNKIGALSSYLGRKIISKLGK